jgi:hypothetical protein
MNDNELHDIIRVSYLSDYKLILTFDDKSKRIIDLEQCINEVKGSRFQELENIEYFKKVRADRELGTIVWPNGYDICPDMLYHMGEEVKSHMRKKKDAS